MYISTHGASARKAQALLYYSVDPSVGQPSVQSMYYSYMCSRRLAQPHPTNTLTTAGQDGDRQRGGEEGEDPQLQRDDRPPGICVYECVYCTCVCGWTWSTGWVRPTKWGRGHHRSVNGESHGSLSKPDVQLTTHPNLPTPPPPSKQIALKNYDPQRDKRFSGVFKLPAIPKCVQRCIVKCMPHMYMWVCA